MNSSNACRGPGCAPNSKKQPAPDVTCGKPSLDPLDAFSVRFIHSKVRQLIGRAGFQESDRDDLLQGFALDLLTRRRRFNPQTANWEAFVVVICENRYATILEHRHAAMRSWRREAGSLNRPLHKGHGRAAEVDAMAFDSQQVGRTGQHHRPHQDAWDLSQDVAAVLASMPPTMRRVCEITMRGSKATAARELDISQGALYEILRRIRTRFEKAGLREYLV